MKILGILLWIYLSTLSANHITNYKIINRCYIDSNSTNMSALREFDIDGISRVWSVDIETLDTVVVDANQSYLPQCPESNYSRLLKESIEAPFPLQNDGIVSTVDIPTITTDLCPSSKSGFEEEFYCGLMRSFPTPVPVTVFITGRWIEKHDEEWSMLKAWDRDGNLSITWGNHTYTHPYHPHKPLVENFVLSAEYNLTEDILALEQKLLSDGVVPSIFFRFPGLVSDKHSMEIVARLGLVTIGSNTWIAKGEPVKQSSIILLHGNKNEHRGINMFQKLLVDTNLTKVDSISRQLMKKR